MFKFFFIWQQNLMVCLSSYLLAPHGAQAVIAFRYSPTLLLPSPPIFSKYYPQTSQIQSLEETSNGLCVGANL